MRLPSLLAATRRRRCGVLVVGSVWAGIVVAGCGSSPKTSSVSAVTRSGLHYAVSVTVKGDQACVTQTYSGIGLKRKPFRQSSRYCGPSGQTAPPTLIQVARPLAALILDRPASCGAVQVGRKGGALTPANSKCSATAPHLRVTVLPEGRAVIVAGIPGVRTVGLAGFPCAFLCTRQLAVKG